MNVSALRERLQDFVATNGEPHHFKLQVVTGTASGRKDRVYDSNGQLLPPSYERNGLRLYGSKPSRSQNRASTISFPTVNPRLAQQLTLTPRGQVNCSLVPVDPPVAA